MTKKTIPLELTAVNISRYFTVKELPLILKTIGDIPILKRKSVNYYNIPCSFDIETTSLTKSNQLDNEKSAFMYEWTFAILHYVIIGRTWEEFEELYETLINELKIYDKLHLIIYVHNLSFEFQFLRKRLSWESVFSLESRKPVKATTIDGIEFRCSYLLSGYGLAKLSNQLTKYKIEKLEGDLDYSLIRHSKTPLTDKEIGYCINDCLVINAYIQEKIERENGIINIPLTKTGYVRNYCRENCLYKDDNKYNDKYKNFRKLITKLTLDKDTYIQLKNAFMGGFTHANAFYSNEIMYNIKSYDFTSSYPFVMISEQFPMSKAEKIILKDIDDFYNRLDLYCCLFDITFTNIKAKVHYENYIPKSHCRNIKKIEENNGRIVSAETITITLTEQDFKIIWYLYEWDDIKIFNFRQFIKGYLPKDFILSILKLYKDKTELKDVVGKEVEYLNSKEMVNSAYGMTVTDICKDEILYSDDDWTEQELDIDKALETYNKSKKRFLYYPWGVWVTAYARSNLFTGIVEFKDDYIYSDTDSIKVINYEKHIEYFESYNRLALQKLKLCMDYYNIPFNMTKPKNIYGEEKQLGIWSDEGVYDKFKTIGAKRYIVCKKGELSITVSGLNKQTAVSYLEKEYGDKVFENFNDSLYIPQEYTGKMTHTYIDDEQEGNVVDYLGNKGNYHEYSSVHLENCDYTMSISDTYAKYLLGIKTITK